jgi:hypothetical protein
MSYPALALCASPRLHPGSQAPGGCDRPCLWSASSLQPDLTPVCDWLSEPCLQRAPAGKGYSTRAPAREPAEQRGARATLAARWGFFASLSLSLSSFIRHPVTLVSTFLFPFRREEGTVLFHPHMFIPWCCPMMKRCALTEFPVRIQHNH